MNPYFIDEPAVISFSGGRTSGYMLWKIIEAHGGTLPDCVKVMFANTGKEMPQTLDFVQACSDNWGVPIIWLEASTRLGEGEENKFVYTTNVVTYETANRTGKPFEEMILARGYAPYPVNRYCSSNLKVRRISDHVKALGMPKDSIRMIGIRYDEPRRAAKIHNKVNDGHPCWCPLYADKQTKHDVAAFWISQNFDLELPNNDGVTDWGNCDLCFLKGRTKRMSIIRERPDLVDWWADMEHQTGSTFRKDEPSYERMKVIASDQGNLFDFDDESIPCFCGD